MTGLGDEVVTRCPTCGYGLTARKYAVPKQCPLCHCSFEEEAAHAPQLTASRETEKEVVVEDKVKDALAVESDEKEESEETRESRITLSVKPDVETGPLGVTTLRMPDAETDTDEVTHDSEEHAREHKAADEPLEAEIVEPRLHPREPEKRHQGAHIEHATPAASAQERTPEYVPPATKLDAYEPPRVSSQAPAQSPPTPSNPSWPPYSSQATSQPPPQPPRVAHARGSLEERVSSEVVGRYADAYRVARATVFTGTLIKVFGVLLGLLVGGGLLALAATQERVIGGMGAIGLLAGILFGGGIFAFFFVLGVVVSAQGQLIKATLDGAVCASPFLTNEQRAEAMSLR